MTIKAKKYQIGNLIHYRMDDPIVDNWDDAIKEASDITGNGYLDIAAGIWHPDSGELLAIVYQGEVFKK
jgi:hypothetical protein